jgi:transitional endoplasmic reticulum ATPase
MTAKQHTTPALHTLSPAQEAAYPELKRAISDWPLVLLEGAAGAGKTTLVHRLLGELGGKRLTVRDLLSYSAGAAHAALDGALVRLIEDALARHDFVVFEDFDTVHDILDSSAHERPYLWASGVRTLLERARDDGKHVAFTAGSFSHPQAPEFDRIPFLTQRGARVAIAEMDASDYAFHLGEAILDAQRLFEHSPKLNTYQLQMLAGFIRVQGRSDETFIRDTLDKLVTQTNIPLYEVEKIDFDDLKGFEDIVAQLTTHVINPLQAGTRFANLGLRPKRGVLLYGPPGTGKTSIGRALAHRMQGKFFMIDGTVSADPAAGFYNLVQWIFRQAKRSAPSVVFIDDADVLFRSDRATGLSRYLLTMLDGLESESAGKVAVILTAMNPNHLPPALLRSGRVELWLETRLPAQAARAEMLARYLEGAPDLFARHDLERAAAGSEGFNAADIRRLVMDVKALYARDILAERKPQPLDAYFDTAMNDIRKSRELLQLASGQRLDVA